jgi:chromosome segregation ATPase
MASRSKRRRRDRARPATDSDHDHSTTRSRSRTGRGWAAAIDAPTTDAEARIAALEAQLAAERAALATERAALAALTIEHDHLRLAYQNLQHELALLRRRLFLAKAERLDTAQLELEFATKLRELDDLNQKLGRAAARRVSAADRQRQAHAARRDQADGAPRPATARPARGAHRADRPSPRGHGHADRLGGELQAVVATRRLRAAGDRAREVP